MPSGTGRDRILVMGDSVMAWNRPGGHSVAQELERQLGRPVVDRSVVGARIMPAATPVGLLKGPIGAQFVPGDWDWIILNGGGNDLWWGCGCTRCDAALDALISRDGTAGALPELVARLRTTGARVMHIGYTELKGRHGPVDHCGEIGARYEARISRMAARDAGTFFLSNRDLVPHRDLSFHAADRIHPSPKASAAIAARVAGTLRRHGG